MWDLSSPTREQAWAPLVEVQSANHQTAREVSGLLFFFFFDLGSLDTSSSLVIWVEALFLNSVE